MQLISTEKYYKLEDACECSQESSRTRVITVEMQGAGTIEGLLDLQFK
jgi:hypothetical protein